MTKLNVKPLSVHDSPESVNQLACERIKKLIEPEKFNIIDKEPDVLFFLSGGTEQIAKRMVKPDRFYLLIGSQHNNAYASATEVKAYLNNKIIPSILLDEEAEETQGVLNDYVAIKSALQNLKGKKLGLIGEVSDWLISSKIPSTILLDTFGIELEVIPWKELTHYSEYEASDSFLNTFSNQSNIDINPTGKVNELLKHVIKSKNLDAITVECFPLVQKNRVTACLPLAKFNNDGIPAGCEGDLTAITGMMLCKELIGKVPWIANINKVSNDVTMFSHCTIAPNMVSDFTVQTHFETGLGTAIQGKFKEDKITVFRFNEDLTTAFIASADVIGRPRSHSACRTQIEVKLTQNDVELLKENPLGNHHLIIPGDYQRILQLACRILGIKILI